jgi:hypothetical protein
MVKISRADKRFARLATPSLAEANILERYDLQEYIFNSREEFCKELGEELTIIGKEVLPSENVGDRIDLLALDPDGNVVIIELKRGSNKLQLLQTVSYAGMIAKWSPERLLELAGKDLAGKIKEDMDETDAINKNQRILLVAESYDYEVLVGAEWLYQRGVEIDCVRVALAVDGASEYLTFTQVFPTPELAEQARRRGSRGMIPHESFGSWEEGLATSTNTEAVEFFKKHLDAGKENKLDERRIILESGSHKFRVRLKKTHARVTQMARFADDMDFWNDRLSSPETIADGFQSGKPLLRFDLRTGEDFAVFQKAIDGELLNVKWDDAGSTLMQSA